MIALEKKINERLHHFDILSLLRLLIDMGYRPDEIRFKGLNSICSQSRLIEGVRFYDDPVESVEITLCIGLLGAQSPLPAYFRRKMESEISSSNAFVDFIGYFDHLLIRDYICNIYPEINRFFLSPQELTMQNYLHILDLRSSSVLHILFSRVFPEAGIELEKVLLNRGIKADPVRLGESRLGGDCVFGRKTAIPVFGRRIVLHCEDEMTDTQVPWPEEIRNRLKRLLFPLLAPLGMEMEIDLVLRSRKRWVRLHPDTYIGYDTIKSNNPGHRRVSIFKGQVKEVFL